MKSNLRKAAERIWSLRGLLVVFFMATIIYGVSFVSHADEKGNITGSDVNLRQTASTTATVLEVLNNNALVDVIAETTGDDGNKWYKITSAAGNTGYVRADFVKKATVTVPVTDTEDKTAYIAGNGANIRQNASTDSGRVAYAAGGSKITIVGEATGSDGFKWYQVSFTGNGTTMTGFIRSDLITFEEPVQAPEVTEIEGEMGEGSESETPSEEPSESEEPSQEPTEPDTPQIPVEASADDLDIMEPESALELLPAGFEQTELTLNDEVFTVWGKGDFYIIYASAKGGEPQYYLYDSVNKGYVAYKDLLSEQDVARPQKEEGLDFKLISIICIAIIVILAIVICIMAYKLSNADYRDNDDDDEDDDEDDGDDVYVDDEDDDEYVDLSDDDDDIELSVDLEEGDVSADAVIEQPVYEAPVYEAPVVEETYVASSYETPVETSTVYEMPVAETVVYNEADVQDAVEEQYMELAPEADEGMEETFYEQPYTEEMNDAEEYDSEELEEELYEFESEEEEEEEAPKKSRKSKKEKKAKKEKKSFGQRFLDYFTVEVDDDDDDDDDDGDDEEEETTSYIASETDDDDDDLNFIDI